MHQKLEEEVNRRFEKLYSLCMCLPQKVYVIAAIISNHNCHHYQNRKNRYNHHSRHILTITIPMIGNLKHDLQINPKINPRINPRINPKINVAAE